jgi:hypothetical protein
MCAFCEVGTDVLWYTEELGNLHRFVFSDVHLFARKKKKKKNINYAVALHITVFDNCVLYLRPLLHLAHEQSLELLRSSSGKR